MVISYLALGDSYTIGEGVTQKESFPYQLAMLLKQKGITLQPIKVVAKTGWTTDELIEAVEREDISQKFGIVTLLIGINNQYRNYSEKTYKKEFEKLLEMAMNFANSQPAVFVLSIPDWGSTPFAKDRNPQAIHMAINRFNEINETITLQKGISYITITDLTRLPDQEKYLTEDQLHYNASMYNKWAELIKEQFLALKH